LITPAREFLIRPETEAGEVSRILEFDILYAPDPGQLAGLSTEEALVILDDRQALEDAITERWSSRLF
jgi:hypothetical protein